MGEVDALGQALVGQRGEGGLSLLQLRQRRLDLALVAEGEAPQRGREAHQQLIVLLARHFKHLRGELPYPLEVAVPVPVHRELQADSERG